MTDPLDPLTFSDSARIAFMAELNADAVYAAHMGVENVRVPENDCGYKERLPALGSVARGLQEILENRQKMLVSYYESQKLEELQAQARDLVDALDVSDLSNEFPDELFVAITVGVDLDRSYELLKEPDPKEPAATRVLQR